MENEVKYLYLDDIIPNRFQPRENFDEQALKELDLEQILEDLYDYEGITDTEIVLLCYEKSTDFCHRHILREYLNENFNTNITELGVD